VCSKRIYKKNSTHGICKVFAQGDYMHTNQRTQKFYFVLGLATVPAFAKDYIVGGQEVGPTDPIRASTVALYDPSPTGHGGSLCTASLIRKNIALTAAHCIQRGGPDPVVLFGRNLHSPDTVRREVEAVAVNPKWNTHAGKGSDQGDIALVKFRGALPVGFKKISTVGKDSEIKNGSKQVLAGYGISNARTKEGAGILRKTEVSVLHNRPGKSEMILDQRHGHGACHGDSGGPAFMKRNGKIVLAGVTNRGYPNRAPDDCAHQVVYTKVPAYRSWIQKSEKKLDSVHSVPRRGVYANKVKSLMARHPVAARRPSKKKSARTTTRLT
jgi:secreted trypsin-like serine protease